MKEQIKTLQQRIEDLVVENDVWGGGEQLLPFGPGGIRRVRAVLPDISERKPCRLLHVARLALHRTTARTTSLPPKVSEEWVDQLHALLQQYPTYGNRR